MLALEAVMVLLVGDGAVWIVFLSFGLAAPGLVVAFVAVVLVAAVSSPH